MSRFLSRVVYIVNYRLGSLISKGQMLIFDFCSGSHFLDLQRNVLLFLELRHVFEIYPSMNFFFKIICRLGDIRMYGVRTKLGQLGKKIDFFFPIQIFFCLLPQVSKHNMS